MESGARRAFQSLKSIATIDRQSLKDIGTLMNPETWAKAVWSSATKREKLNAFCYDWSLFLTVAIQFWIVMFFLCLDANTFKTGNSMNTSISVILGILQFFQALVLISAHIGMMKELVALYVRPVKIWCIYCATLITFGALFFTAFAYDRSAFGVDGYAPDAADDPNADGEITDVATVNDVTRVYIFFVYFSAAIITSTGFGDIVPNHYWTQAATNCLMLIGAVYGVGVFGLTLAHFRSFQKLSAEEAAKRASDPSVVMQIMNIVDSFQFARRMRELHPWLDTARRWCIRHIALFSIVFETIITLLVFAIPGDPFDPITSEDGSRYTIKLVIIIIMVVLQSLMSITVLFVSFRLVRAINNKDLSANFLVQSYVSTALLFAGIYFILFIATPSHQFSRTVDFDSTIFEVLYMFVHFSLTVMSTTGFGEMYARGVIARMFVVVQMLVSVLYNAVIIGLGTSQLIDMQSAKAQQQFDELRRHVSRHASAENSHAPSGDELELESAIFDEDEHSTSSMPLEEPDFVVTKDDIVAAQSDGSSDASIDSFEGRRSVRFADFVADDSEDEELNAMMLEGVSDDSASDDEAGYVASQPGRFGKSFTRVQGDEVDSHEPALGFQ